MTLIKSRSTKPHEPARNDTNEKSSCWFVNGSCGFVNRFSCRRTPAGLMNPKLIDTHARRRKHAHHTRYISCDARASDFPYLASWRLTYPLSVSFHSVASRAQVRVTYCYPLRVSGNLQNALPLIHDDIFSLRLGFAPRPGEFREYRAISEISARTTLSSTVICNR